MRKSILAVLFFVSALTWATPGQDWLAKGYESRILEVEGFSSAYVMALSRSAQPYESGSALIVSMPVAQTFLPAMERYYQKTKDYAKDPGYLQEQLIWDYLLRSPKAGPILRKLIDAGTVRPPEPLPAVPN